MSFPMPATEEIVGHGSQTQSLLADLATGNVAHAYLFAGKKHLGKFTIAKWFAKTLLLSDAKDEDQERLAFEIDRLFHPDILVIDQLWIEDLCEDFDVIAKSSNISQQHRHKSRAKTDTISIDDIRALQEKLQEVSGRTFRCCLIRSAERMREEAVNALLKILEEPPAGVVFLLTTESLSALLPTLVSRSRVLRFEPLASADLAPLLRDTEDEEARFLLRLAQGAPGAIFRLLRDPDLLRLEHQQYAKAVAFWHAHTLGERLRLLDPLLKRGDESENFLLHLALSLREERDSDPHLVSALTAFVSDQRTNASRPLLAQRLALSVSEKRELPHE